MIDFSALSGVMTLEFSNQYTASDLRATIIANLEALAALVEKLPEAHVMFEPPDEGADDPYAVDAADRTIGWSLAHLVLHVTASLEEGVSISSMLARGVELEPGTRYRYEPDWRMVTTKAEVLQRLAESRRMCLAYLDTWPAQPHLDNLRKMAENTSYSHAKVNAVGAALGGLRHWHSHLAQFQRVAEQAAAAV
jgi:DinB superfamily